MVQIGLKEKKNLSVKVLKSKCVITSDLGYMKFGPVWTNLFVDWCFGVKHLKCIDTSPCV